MKKNLVLLLILFIGKNVCGQNSPVSYINYPKGNNTQIMKQATDPKINVITLKNEKEFEFWSMPLPWSCATWSSIDGKWKRKNDTIIFYDKYIVREPNAKFSYENNPDNKYYFIDFKANKDFKLTERDLKIQFDYYISKPYKVDYNAKLDENFDLKIPYKDIPNLKKLSSINYEYYLPNGEKRSDHIIEDYIPGQKERAIPNKISITFIENPKKETVYRTTKATLIDGKLHIISSEKTSSTLKDDSYPLKFKNYYQKESGE